MTTSHSQWYQTLDTDTKSAINKLRQHRPIWNLVLPLFVLLWIGLGCMAMWATHWSLQVVAYVLMGMVIHGIGNFMHEGIHGNMFRSKHWNRWVGFLAGLPTFLAVSAFGTDHLLHHKYTRSEEDPDELLHMSENRTMQTLWFYAWFFLGTFIFGIRLPYVMFKRATRAEKFAVLIERLLMYALLGGLFAAAYYFDFFNVIVHCWFIPLIVAILLVNVRGWAEHQLTSTDHPLRQTRTVTSSRFYSFLNINLNYHLEHHLFPSVPWYNLRAVHRLLLPEYEKAGASIYRSYFWFVWDAFRIGIHGRTPDLN
jgi:fatty acid desaturase